MPCLGQPRLGYGTGGGGTSEPPSIAPSETPVPVSAQAADNVGSRFGGRAIPQLNDRRRAVGHRRQRWRWRKHVRRRRCCGPHRRRLDRLWRRSAPGLRGGMAARVRGAVCFGERSGRPRPHREEGVSMPPLECLPTPERAHTSFRASVEAAAQALGQEHLDHGFVRRQRKPAAHPRTDARPDVCDHRTAARSGRGPATAAPAPRPTRRTHPSSELARSEN